MDADRPMYRWRKMTPEQRDAALEHRRQNCLPWHGRTSYKWNGEDDKRGRQVWHRAAESEMKSDRHFWASLNYVLHNAVRHGYVEHWQDWPHSNAAHYLSEVGRDEAERRWKEYPILDYGQGWDPPEL